PSEVSSYQQGVIGEMAGLEGETRLDRVGARTAEAPQHAEAAVRLHGDLAKVHGRGPEPAGVESRALVRRADRTRTGGDGQGRGAVVIAGRAVAPAWPGEPPSRHALAVGQVHGPGDPRVAERDLGGIDEPPVAVADAAEHAEPRRLPLQVAGRV